MKKINSIFALMALSLHLFGQINAGIIPNGFSPKLLNINLSTSNIGSEVSAKLDLNSDLIDDVQIVLYKGYPAIDIPNSIRIIHLGSPFRFCDTTLSGGSYTRLYNHNELINCLNQTNWGSYNQDIVSQVGCFICPAPAIVTNKYLGFIDTSNNIQGWINLKFDIAYNTSTIRLNIDTLFFNQNPLQTNAVNDETNFFLYPNPTKDIFTFSNCDYMDITNLSVINSLGQKLQIEKIGNCTYKIVSNYNGTAYVTFQSGNKFVRKKIIISD